MASGNEPHARVECLGDDGRLAAWVCLWARGSDAPEILTPANASGEPAVQLTERCRYEYELRPEPGAGDDLVLASGPGIEKSQAGGARERGFIEPGDYCGLMPLIVVHAGDPLQTPVARGSVEVRSVKLSYREDYRAMLGHIAGQCEGLLLDSRSATQLRLEPRWDEQPELMEQQIEFLRHTLESPLFRAALAQIQRNPHRRLEDEMAAQPVAQPLRSAASLARQIAMSPRREALPQAHPLRVRHPQITTLPAEVIGPRGSDDLDTAENRFVKLALTEFRDFARGVERRAQDKPAASNARLLADAQRLSATLDGELRRGFWPDVSRLRLLPLGSPALQRRSGYREVLRAWMQFHTGAQLRWDGGPDVWRAGARNVATLYEYWLFFQLDALFREMFHCDERLSDALIEPDESTGIVRMTLKRGIELRTPVAGVWSDAAQRKLHAELHFNQSFRLGPDNQKRGSWTRNMRPDYTLSIWPDGYSKPEAEASEVMVHVHFDAKYRVDTLHALFGSESEDADEEDAEAKPAGNRTAAKRADLLKMHAYRDAIRRSAGAYVLYPGEPSDNKEPFRGYHEILPGLGAFAIRPRDDGAADGMDSLRSFLRDVIAHLSDRASARERVTYHLAEAYRGEGKAKETPARYSVALPERDVFDAEQRAVPPAEHLVLVAYCKDQAHFEWVVKHGMINLRLETRAGSFEVPFDFGNIRHVVLRPEKSVGTLRLWRLKRQGFRIFTKQDLIDLKYPRPGGEIYAIFDIEPDSEFAASALDDGALNRILATRKAERKGTASPLGRQGAEPEVIALSALREAMRDGE